MNKKRVVIGVLSFSLITLIIISLVLAADPNPGVFGHNSKDIDFSNGIDINNRVIISPGVNSPDSGFIKFGDGKGWKLHFAKRDGTKLVTFKDNGNVGIGKVDPAYSLDVNGGINANQICINGTCYGSWPAGPQGPKGDTGAQGIQGIPGPVNTYVQSCSVKYTGCYKTEWLNLKAEGWPSSCANGYFIQQLDQDTSGNFKFYCCALEMDCYKSDGNTESDFSYTL